MTRQPPELSRSAPYRQERVLLESNQSEPASMSSPQRMIRMPQVRSNEQSLLQHEDVGHHDSLVQERHEEVPGVREVDPVGDVPLGVAVRAGVIGIEIECEHKFEFQSFRSDVDV